MLAAKSSIVISVKSSFEAMLMAARPSISAKAATSQYRDHDHRNSQANKCSSIPRSCPAWLCARWRLVGCELGRKLLPGVAQAGALALSERWEPGRRFTT